MKRNLFAGLTLLVLASMFLAACGSAAAPATQTPAEKVVIFVGFGTGTDPDTKEHTPACVRVCAPKARYFGDLDNPNSKVNKLIADKSGLRLLDQTGNKPQVYYLSGGAGPSVPSSRANESKA